MDAKQPLAIKPAINACRNVQPPLDYTFMCLTSVSDCLDEEPRTTSSASSSPGKSKRGSISDEQVTKRDSNAIRLSNNVIQEWTDFQSTVEKLLFDPINLEWIDLSFNDLSTVDKCILEFPNLKVLYLHGNGIEKLSELDKLASLPILKTLTMHGNPIEEIPGYRQYALSRIPQLKHFDFSSVTKQDRACALTWSEMSRSRRKKKP